MKSVTFAGGALEIGEVGLGAMRFSTAGRPEDSASAVRTIHAALDLGMTLLDTADVYCLDEAEIGHNERLVARALSERGHDRDKAVVATKGGLVRARGKMFPDGRPAHIKQACELSLVALGVDRIDLYQLHAKDSRVPYAESVGALAELASEGKIRFAGLSNVKVADIEEAFGIVPIVAIQNKTNAFDAASFKNGTVAWAAQRGILIIAHSPLGGHDGHERTSKNAVLQAVGLRHGVSAYEAEIAWLRAACPRLVPIPGATKIEHVASCAHAATIELGAEDRKELAARFSFAPLEPARPI